MAKARKIAPRRKRTATNPADRERQRSEAARRDRLKRLPGAASRTIVYGNFGDDEVAFIPAPRARLLNRIWSALLASKTWRDWKRLAPRGPYREIRQWNWDNGREVAEMRLDAPFDYYTMTAVPDGDFPGALRQEALAWMPADVVRDFGNVGSSMVSGEILYLDSKDTEAIVQRLKRAGFRCRRDQDLVGPLL